MGPLLALIADTEEHIFPGHLLAIYDHIFSLSTHADPCFYVDITLYFFFILLVKTNGGACTKEIFPLVRMFVSDSFVVA